MRNVFRTKYDFKNAATKEKITAALIKLLEKKDLNRITVAQICDSCGIHRSTFYRHYSDVYAVLEEMENNIFEEYKAVLVPFSELRRESLDEAKIKRIVMRYLHICYFNRKAILTLGKLGQYSGFYNKCVDLLHDLMIEMLSDLEWTDKKYLEFSSRYMAANTFYLLFTWLEQNEIDYQDFYKMYTEIFYADIDISDRLSKAPKEGWTFPVYDPKYIKDQS